MKKVILILLILLFSGCIQQEVEEQPLVNDSEQEELNETEQEFVDLLEEKIKENYEYEEEFDVDPIEETWYVPTMEEMQ